MSRKAANTPTSSALIPQDSIGIATTTAPYLITSPFTDLATYIGRLGLDIPVIMDDGFQIDNLIKYQDILEAPLTGHRPLSFYDKCFCPGQTNLKQSNTWKALNKPNTTQHVKAAAEVLALVHMSHYIPLRACLTNGPLGDVDVPSRQHMFDLIQERLRIVNGGLSSLMQVASEPNELVTVSILLSKVDMALTEFVHRTSHAPRWLLGLRIAERVLSETFRNDELFWTEGQSQPCPLRVDLAVVVGYGIIVKEAMSELPPGNDTVVSNQALRFTWLLAGSEKSLFEIHGGCGFSRKLLHIFSQITYCASLLKRDLENPIVSTTANFLHDELKTLRQWSVETVWNNSWESAKAGPPVVTLCDRLEDIGFDAVIHVGAESWRIAAIIYLQCRLLGLSPCHQEVTENMNGLAQCIRLLPINGPLFTAQAPLLPIYLLGALTTNTEHRRISICWFEAASQAPVRSMIPFIYGRLKEIWTCIDARNGNLRFDHTQCGFDWWERFVAKAQEKYPNVSYSL